MSEGSPKWPPVAALVLLLAALGIWRAWLAPMQQARARAGSAELEGTRDEATRELAGLGLVEEGFVLDGTHAALSWRPPGECVEVYALRVDEHYRDDSVSLVLGREEEHGTWQLAIAAHERAELRERGIAGGPLTRVDALLVEDLDGKGRERRRELVWSATEVGPRAPDLACRARSWDLLEDAIALAWPVLPGRSTRVGRAWRGAAVEGRCHETTCLDRDGRFDPELPCRARPWRETLVGVGQGIAVIRGAWDDGRTNEDDPEEAEIGILTSRVAVLEGGRPLIVRATIDQRWLGVRRTLSLVRIDDCGGPTVLDGAESLAGIRARLRSTPELPVAPLPRPEGSTPEPREG